MDEMTFIILILQFSSCFLWTQTEGTVVGKACTTDEDCYYQPSQFALCFLGQCACVRSVTDWGPVCGPSIGTVVGKPCTRNEDCYYQQKHVVICQYGQCRCMLGMHDWGPLCRKSIVSGYKEYCLFEEDCNHSDPNMICKYQLLSGECSCKSGYHCCGDHGQCIPDVPIHDTDSLQAHLFEYIPMLALIAIMLMVGCITYTWKYVRLNRERNRNANPPVSAENGRIFRPLRRRGRNNRLAQLYVVMRSNQTDSEPSTQINSTPLAQEPTSLSPYHSMTPLQPPPSYEEALKYRVLQSNYFATEVNVPDSEYDLASGSPYEDIWGDCGNSDPKEDSVPEEEVGKTVISDLNEESTALYGVALCEDTGVVNVAAGSVESVDPNNATLDRTSVDITSDTVPKEADILNNIVAGEMPSDVSDVTSAGEIINH